MTDEQIIDAVLEVRAEMDGRSARDFAFPDLDEKDLVEGQTAKDIAVGAGRAAGLDPADAIKQWELWKKDRRGHYKALMLAMGFSPDLAEAHTAEAFAEE